MKLSLLIFTALSVSTAFARADVSLRNGNFYTSFRDMTYPGGMEPKIERVYNSKSDFSGMFGYSWGSEYESRLAVDPDGSLVVTSFGGGAENRFVPKNYTPKDLNAGLDLLVNAARKAGMVTSAKAVEDYKKRISTDTDYRSRQYSIYVTKGLIPRKPIPDGTQYTSLRFLYQYITKAKGGYIRIMESGQIEKYNEMGKLVQVMDRNKNFINFTYDKNGRMIQMIDNQNRKMTLSYNQAGLVEKIVGESGKFAAYKYDAKGLMTYCRDQDGVENTFSYTKDEFRNLAEIGYLQDKDSKGQPKKMIISYYGRDKFVSVKSVVNPDGTINEYDYVKDPKKPDYFAVHVLLKESNGTRISDSNYEYFSKQRAGDSPLTIKMISTVDGDKTETEYDQKLGFPIKVTNNGRVTTMEYDAKGRMTKKNTAVDSTELSYDATVGKVNKVVRKLKSGTVLWSTFQYESGTGNLMLAQNSDKKSVKLVYDQRGRIRALVDQTGKQLSFKYNENSKPIEISDPKLGTVKFSYKNSGDVDKVESNGGASVATEVMRALQSLIDITAPAGVTMGL